MNLLNYLLKCTQIELWTIFLIENSLIVLLTLIIGKILIKKHRQPQKPIKFNQWLVCGITNLINTAVTYVGFWLWANGYIQIKAEINLQILIDFVALFFAMDILMYILHYLIHHSVLYKKIHYYHHLSVNPTPIDLFILHPLETVAFGGLWLSLLWCYPFNLYGIAIYLTINVLFGMIGHLGFENASIQNTKITKYLGTSAFHHNHHKQISYNYGFYTNLWDRLFSTYAEN